MKAAILVLLALAVFPTRGFATANYEYGPDEYVTIVKGLSPDGRIAITAHGEGDYGYGNFHLYLTDATTGRHIGPLEEVDPVLDTAADAFGAIWSKDSSMVTIVWRWSRHDPFKAVTYKITPKRAFPRTKEAVDADEHGAFWAANCSGRSPTPTPKRFGTPKKQKE